MNAQISSDSDSKELGNLINEPESFLSCTQADMDPCSYVNISGFISAFITELNNQLNKCPARSWDCNPSPCCTTETVIALSSLDPFDVNPFFLLFR